MSTRARLIVVVGVLLVVVHATRAAAQDALTQAKTLYASADYEQALGLLDKSENTHEAHFYRALCLIALGRTDAAEKQISALVLLDPMFAPPAGEVSPRVVNTFMDTRRRMLPQLARKTFNEARQLFQSGEREKARERFEITLKMLDDSMLDEGTDLADLRLVASGFIDLALTSSSSAPAATTATTAAPQPPSPQPAAAPVSSPSAAAPRASNAVASLPITIVQALPPWRPDSVSARRTYTGAVRVEIDTEGKVTAAQIARSVHASYDPLVLQAARNWRYRPAMLNGTPIPSEKTVEIVLQPDREEE